MDAFTEFRIVILCINNLSGLHNQVPAVSQQAVRPLNYKLGIPETSFFFGHNKNSVDVRE